jgi:RNA polymerase sigma factor (sigma-70 family)
MGQLLNGDQLLELFREGDPKADNVIFEKFYPQLTSYSHSIINNKSQAEDIAVEALTKLFMRRAIFGTTQHYECFLHLVVRNSSINYDFRQESHEKLMEELYKAIEHLPQRSKYVIKYLFIQKMSYQEAADLMNTTVKNIENLRAYALKKLRVDLSQSNDPIILRDFFASLTNK